MKLRDVLFYVRSKQLQKNQPKLLRLQHVFCQPLTPVNANRFQFIGGLYSPQGYYIAESGLTTSGQMIVCGNKLSHAEVNILPGKSLYLGICHYHFGHFLVQTLSRLWFLHESEITQFDHIVLLPLNDHIPAFVYELFDILGVADRIISVNRLVQLEFVYLPAPALEYPSLVYQAINRVQHLFISRNKINYSKQALFLSRTQLTPGHHRVIIGEHRLEQCLREEGFQIFYPEQHSIEEQIHTLAIHKTIIGFAGSALHTLILAGGQKNIIAYSARPIPNVFKLIDKALCNHALYLNAARHNQTGCVNYPVGFKPQWINADSVLTTLKRKGLIQSFTPEPQSSYTTGQELAQYNTALLLRKILELSQTATCHECIEEIRLFKQHYAFDKPMLVQACRESELLRQYFSAEQ